MDESRRLSGHCLCGDVRVLAQAVSRRVGFCHCGMCRSWSGGPLLAVDCGTEVSFEGADRIGNHASSDWAERGFCKRCGSHLFFRLKATGQFLMPPRPVRRRGGLRARGADLRRSQARLPCVRQPDGDADRSRFPGPIRRLTRIGIGHFRAARRLAILAGCSPSPSAVVGKPVRVLPAASNTISEKRLVARRPIARPKLRSGSWLCYWPGAAVLRPAIKVRSGAAHSSASASPRATQLKSVGTSRRLALAPERIARDRPATLSSLR